jgi:hypothetical protein
MIDLSMYSARVPPSYKPEMVISVAVVNTIAHTPMRGQGAVSSSAATSLDFEN